MGGKGLDNFVHILYKKNFITFAYVWQSQKGIEYYSITYFEHITEFNVP